MVELPIGNFVFLKPPLGLAVKNRVAAGDEINLVLFRPALDRFSRSINQANLGHNFLSPGFVKIKPHLDLVLSHNADGLMRI